MQETDFLKLMDKMHTEEKAVHTAKSADYADREGRNVLANFERISHNLGISREMALMIYLEKHMDAIRSYIRHGSVRSEPIAGRITDARVYLALFRAMIEGDKP